MPSIQFSFSAHILCSKIRPPYRRRCAQVCERFIDRADISPLLHRCNDTALITLDAVITFGASRLTKVALIPSMTFPLTAVQDARTMKNKSGRQALLKFQTIHQTRSTAHRRGTIGSAREGQAEIETTHNTCCDSLHSRQSDQ